MAPVRYGVNRRPLLFLVPAALVLIGGCIGLLAFSPSYLTRTIGGVGFIFFGLAAFEAIRVGLHRGEALVIDHFGIHDRIYRYGTIPWEEVHDAFAHKQSANNGHMLCLVVDHPGTYSRRLPLVLRLLAKGNRAFGASEVSINFSMVAADVDEAVEAVRGFLRMRPRAFPHSRCPKCGYDLRATPTLCPECGEKYTPLDSNETAEGHQTGRP